MHKFTIPGLLTLSLFFISSSAMAGNAADCEVLKDPGHSLYAPSLYGLCVAWHNADENARDLIAEKFLKRADFPVPGSETTGRRAPEQDFYCPCWDDVTFDDICAWGDPLSAAVVTGVSGFVAFTDGIMFEGLMSSTGTMFCRHVVQQWGSQTPELLVEITELSADESADCQAELEAVVLDRAMMCPP